MQTRRVLKSSEDNESSRTSSKSKSEPRRRTSRESIEDQLSLSSTSVSPLKLHAQILDKTLQILTKRLEEFEKSVKLEYSRLGLRKNKIEEAEDMDNIRNLKVNVNNKIQSMEEKVHNLALNSKFTEIEDVLKNEFKTLNTMKSELENKIDRTDKKIVDSKAKEPEPSKMNIETTNIYMDLTDDVNKISNETKKGESYEFATYSKEEYIDLRDVREKNQLKALNSTGTNSTKSVGDQDEIVRQKSTTDSRKPRISKNQRSVSVCQDLSNYSNAPVVIIDSPRQRRGIIKSGSAKITKQKVSEFILNDPTSMDYLAKASSINSSNGLNVQEAINAVCTGPSVSKIEKQKSLSGRLSATVTGLVKKGTHSEKFVTTKEKLKKTFHKKFNADSVDE